MRPPSERGTIFKKWTKRVPVCVVYPNTYYIGMSNLAVHLLYGKINERPDMVCERAFLTEGGRSLSVESGRPLCDFEVLFFTLPFEMDYPNVVSMLKGGGVPFLASERGENAPLVVGGGVCAMANPEPLSQFFDLFVLGDVESCVPPFIEAYVAARGKRRTEVIDALSAFEWVYDPARLAVSYREDGTVEGFIPPDFSVRIERYRGPCLAASTVVTSDTEFADMLLVEGTRGCPSRCAFCLAGNIYPFIADRLEAIGGDVKEVGIIGGGVSYHPHLVEIIDRLRAMGRNVHLPSLRLDEVPLDAVEAIAGTVKTLTFGIEAGTEPLRRRIGKPITDEEIAERIAAIAGIKSFNFKFYFMVGLPGEGRPDVEAIVDLVKGIHHILIRKGAGKGRVGTVTVHASPFVPKAATPFQWLPMEEMKALKEKISVLKRGLARVPNTRFTHESVKYGFLQGVLARGDRRLKEVIVRLAGGQTLPAIMRENSINLSFYATRERRPDETFPWDFIAGTERERLARRLSLYRKEGL